MLSQENHSSVIKSLEHLLADYEHDQLSNSEYNNLPDLDYFTQILKQLKIIVASYYKKADKQNNNFDNKYNLKAKTSPNFNNIQLSKPTIYNTLDIAAYKDKIQTLANQKININGKEISLTKREYQCIFYLMDGLSAKQTAYNMNISTRTVECHLDNIRKKTNCRTKVDLVRFFSKVII